MQIRVRLVTLLSHAKFTADHRFEMTSLILGSLKRRGFISEAGQFWWLLLIEYKKLWQLGYDGLKSGEECGSETLISSETRSFLQAKNKIVNRTAPT